MEPASRSRRYRLVAKDPVLRGMGRTEVVETDQHVGEIAPVFPVDALDQILRGDALGLRLQHDRRAVGVVGAHVIALVAAQLLEPHPDIRLYGFEQIPEMDRAVGVRQGAGDQNSASWVMPNYAMTRWPAGA